MERIIVHLDMDAFFASVEERFTPAFRGKPVVVGSDPHSGQGRGVVSTANYKAREYGIHSAMPITKAWQASQLAKSQGKEEVIFVPPDFEAYHRVSAGVLFIVRQYAGAIEQASIDEYYFELKGAGNFAEAKLICKKIQQEITQKEQVTCSIGIGPNKLIAKIAANMKKPNGLTVVPTLEAESFLEPLPIRTIPGIGPKTATVLAEKNVSLVRDIKHFSREELYELFGKWGSGMYERVRGIDDSPIVEHWEAKSIGEQNTFQQDTFDALFLSDELKKYCERIFKTMLSDGFLTSKTISLTVRFSNFKTISSAKSFTPPLGIHDLKKLKLEAFKLLLPFLDRRRNPQLQKIRLLGIRLENLAK